MIHFILRGSQKLVVFEGGASDFDQASAGPRSRAYVKHKCNEQIVKNEDADNEKYQLLNHEQYRDYENKRAKKAPYIQYPLFQMHGKGKAVLETCEDR